MILIKRAFREFFGPSRTDAAALKLSSALSQTTFLVKTFERPKALWKLLDSIDRFYGHLGGAVTIMIADDSEKPVKPAYPSRNRVIHYPLPFDVGLSHGRNFMVDRVETPYLVLLDDDFVFNKRTRIERFVENMAAHPGVDIIAGSVFNKGKKRNDSYMTMKLENGRLERWRRPVGEDGGLPLFDFVPNFFIAKTEVVRGVRWQDDLKIAEHEAFFLDCLSRGVRIGADLSIAVDHYQLRTEHYRKFRKHRIEDYTKLWRSRYGVTEIIDHPA